MISGVVSEMTERVMVMYGGRVMETGRTDDVFRRLAHPYTRGLFAASPHALPSAPPIAGRRPRLAAIPGQVPDPLHRPAGCPFADRCPRVAADCRAAPPPLRPLGAGEAPEHCAACVHPHGRRAAA